MDKRYMNTAEAARYFNVQPATILNWERKNYIPCLKVGKTRRFALTDIQAFENSRKQVQQA